MTETDDTEAPIGLRTALELAKIIEDGDLADAQMMILQLDEDTRTKTLLSMASVLATHLATGCAAHIDPDPATTTVEEATAMHRAVGLYERALMPRVNRGYTLARDATASSRELRATLRDLTTTAQSVHTLLLNINARTWRAADTDRQEAC